MLKMKYLSVLIVLIVLVVGGCAGMNPNPGERTADIANESGDYSRAVSIVRPSAEKGEPWAQLRLGIYYEKGIAVEKDITKSTYWYTKCAIQKGEGGWAEGMLVGSVGKAGYFNQNTDALIAQWRLADLLLEGNGSLPVGK
jgi:TPR repeat protein